MEGDHSLKTDFDKENPCSALPWYIVFFRQIKAHILPVVYVQLCFDLSVAQLSWAQDKASEALSSEKVEVSFTIKTREKSPTMVAHSGSTTLKKLPEINSLQFI